MSSRVVPGIQLNAYWDLHETSWKVGMDENLLKLSLLVQMRVKGVVEDYPDTPVHGDTWLLSADHDEYANHMIAYDTDDWITYIPFDGMVLYDLGQKEELRFDITNGWEQTTSPDRIKEKYESNANTNAFTDALLTKLNGIETGATADMTASEIKTAYESNSNTNVFTDAEKSKLNLLSGSRFLGTYVSLTALQVAHPSPTEGAFAYVDGGIGLDILCYIWDYNDNKYVLQAGSNSLDTPEQIKMKYESNLDTNAFTDADKAKLDEYDPDAPSLPPGGTEGQFLSKASDADGDAEWVDLDIPEALPDMTGQSGKFLSTDGTEASWESIPEPEEELPDTTGQDGKLLGVVSGEPTWVVPPESGIEEAPVDGRTYGRRNENWEEIATTGGGGGEGDVMIFSPLLTEITHATTTGNTTANATKVSIFQATEDFILNRANIYVNGAAGASYIFFVGRVNSSFVLTDIIHQSAPTSGVSSNFYIAFDGGVEILENDLIVFGACRVDGANTLASRIAYAAPSALTDMVFVHSSFVSLNTLTLGDNYSSVNSATNSLRIQTTITRKSAIGYSIYDRQKMEFPEIPGTNRLVLEATDFTGNVVKRIESESTTIIEVPAGLTVRQPVSFIRTGEGAVTFEGASGVSVFSADGMLNLRSRYSMCSLVPMAYNSFVLVGDIA